VQAIPRRPARRSPCASVQTGIVETLETRRSGRRTPVSQKTGSPRRRACNRSRTFAAPGPASAGRARGYRAPDGPGIVVASWRGRVAIHFEEAARPGTRSRSVDAVAAHVVIRDVHAGHPAGASAAGRAREVFSQPPAARTSPAPLAKRAAAPRPRRPREEDTTGRSDSKRAAHVSPRPSLERIETGPFDRRGERPRSRSPNSTPAARRRPVLPASAQARARTGGERRSSRPHSRTVPRIESERDRAACARAASQRVPDADGDPRLAEHSVAGAALTLIGRSRPARPLARAVLQRDGPFRASA